MDMQEKYRQQLDISYSYHLAKRMEKHRTNEELGYRTAGSKAELATGEMLAQEMHTIGFPIIHKDAITVDAWEFERAKMTFLNEKGRRGNDTAWRVSDEFCDGRTGVLLGCVCRQRNSAGL